MQKRSWSSRILLSAFQGQNSIFDQKLCNFFALGILFLLACLTIKGIFLKCPFKPPPTEIFWLHPIFRPCTISTYVGRSYKTFFNDEKMILSKHWLKKEAILLILLSHYEKRNIQSAPTTRPFEKKIWYAVILLKTYQ